MPAKHYYVFKASKAITHLDKEAWDSLRTEACESDFRFEASVEDYEANCTRRTDCLEVAEVIRNLMQLLGKDVPRLVSLGAGKGIVEWHLKRIAPELRLVCTDYAEAGVDRLRRLFHRCDQVVPFNIMKGDYRSFGEGVVLLMNRISTEFASEEWLHIFCSCRNAGIKHIIFIPTELASFKLKVVESLRHFVRKFLRRRDTFCGWLYSKNELEKLMSSDYCIESFTRMGCGALYLLSVKR